MATTAGITRLASPLAPTTTALGANVRAARQGAGLNARQLAGLGDAAPSNISNIESGRIANPGAYTLYSLAVALGVRMEDLMGVPRVEKTTKGRSRTRRP